VGSVARAKQERAPLEPVAVCARAAPACQSAMTSKSCVIPAV